MKKYCVLLSLLLGGCVAADRKEENKMCVKWMPIPKTKTECVGGRGVAPEICIEKTVIEQFCVRYEQLIR